jgi:putative DNA primase/helicase
VNALKVLGRLENVTGRCGKWMACCPAHEDKTPSLAISETDDRVLIHCFAGCATEDVIATIGLSLADLFYNKLYDNKLTEGRRRRYQEALITERLQVAIINSAERNERSLTTFEQERRLLGQHRISKIEAALYE